MSSRVFHACFLLLMGALAYGGETPAPNASKEELAKAIGINAVLTVNADIAIEKRIRSGKVEKATDLLAGEYLRMLPQLREFDAEIVSEPRVRELRDRVVKTLQTRWLRQPPMYLDEESAAYLEHACASIPDCPKGRVHPLKQPTLPPAQ